MSGRTAIAGVDDEPGLPGRWVGYCTCAAWDHIHEPGCGWDVDDDPAPDPDEEP